jgi:hypothetical protein
VPTNMPPQAHRPTNWSNMLTYISVLILVGTEIFGIALAGAWAIGGLFESRWLFTSSPELARCGRCTFLESGRMGSMTGLRLNQTVCRVRSETLRPFS